MEAIAPHRWTERYEALRFDTEAYKEKTGQNVEVFLANMGRIPQHKARADFSTSFLQVGEFNVHLNEGFQDDETMSGIDKCAKAAAEFPYDAAVICSTDATYPDIVRAGAEAEGGAAGGGGAVPRRSGAEGTGGDLPRGRRR